MVHVEMRVAGRGVWEAAVTLPLSFLSVTVGELSKIPKLRRDGGQGAAGIGSGRVVLNGRQSLTDAR